ncbi:MAG: nuclear transport factor 2 family protein [Actinomycetota bacterium]
MHQNEEMVRRFYAAFSSGDGEALTTLMAPDIVWSSPGNSQISGDHKGRDEVLALFGLCGELTQGNLSVELLSINVAADGTVVTVHRVKGERDGNSLDVLETETGTIEDGHIARVEEGYSNQAASDDFWA